MLVKRGFTLIEVLVSVAIFSMLISVFAGFLVGSIRSQQKALASQQLIDSVSYNLEYISRALRMAKKDDIGIGDVNCLSGNKVNYELTREGEGIKFRNYQDECQEFFWDDVDKRLYELKNEETPLPLTPAALKVVSFMIEGSESWGQSQIPLTQPRVTLSLKIERSGGAGEPPLSMNIQTTISQRNLNKIY